MAEVSASQQEVLDLMEREQLEIVTFDNSNITKMYAILRKYGAAESYPTQWPSVRTVRALVRKGLLVAHFSDPWFQIWRLA